MRIFFCLAIFSFFFFNIQSTPTDERVLACHKKKVVEEIPQRDEEQIDVFPCILRFSRTNDHQLTDIKETSELEIACRVGNHTEVARLLALATTHPTPRALKSALDRKDLETAKLFLSHPGGLLLIQRKMFRDYCRPDYMPVALWILQHGQGDPYPPLNPS